MKCFECGKPAQHNHHVVPKSMGGTATIPLCGECHSIVHGNPALISTSRLTRAAMQQMKAKGLYTGGKPPYGFHVVDGALVEDQAEQATLAMVREYRANGLSLRKIAQALSEAGLQTRNGKAFAPGSIGRMAA